MRFNIFLFTTVLFIGCNTKITQRKIDVIENEISKIYKKPILILSCIRCGCFVDLFKSNNPKVNDALKNYDIFSDSTCSSHTIFKQKVNHISSKIIDSIYEENYNVIIIKKKNERYIAKLIETEGSGHLSEILTKFLK